MIVERANTGLAVLKATMSADGFWNIKTEQATVGKVYVVDLESRRTEKWHNLKADKDFVCEVIDAMGDDGTWAPFPIELLEIAT